MDLQECVKKIKNQEITRYLLTRIIENINYVIKENNKKLDKLKDTKDDKVSFAFFCVSRIIISQLVIAAMGVLVYLAFDAKFNLALFLTVEFFSITFVSYMINTESSVRSYRRIQRVNEQKRISQRYSLGINEIRDLIIERNNKLLEKRELIELKLKKNDKTLHQMYNLSNIPMKYRNIVAIIKFDLYLKSYNITNVNELIRKYDSEKLAYRFTGKLDLLADIARAQRKLEPTIYFYVIRINNMAKEYISNSNNKLRNEELEEYEKSLEDLVNNKIWFEDFIDNNKEVI